MKKDKRLSPSRQDLIVATFKALQSLNRSAPLNEIFERLVEQEKYSDAIMNEMHCRGNIPEVNYEMRWALTYLKAAGYLENEARNCWTIASNYVDIDASEIDPKDVENKYRQYVKDSKKIKGTDKNHPCNTDDSDEVDNTDEIDVEEDLCPGWKTQVLDLLLEMDETGFERLTGDLMSKCGFAQVSVTGKSGDKGIDGTAKMIKNGIISENVAFQCKRYDLSNTIGPRIIREFRGSLPPNISNGIFFTTSRFTTKAKEAAEEPGFKKIDLIDGNDFVALLAKHHLGLKPVEAYDVDSKFFEQYGKDLQKVGKKNSPTTMSKK